MTLRSILSPVDFSEHSRHALRWAGAFATRFHSRLTVLSVVDPLLAEAAKIRLGQDLATAETEPALREFVAATWPGGSDPSVPISFATPVGDPADAIVEAASTGGFDLIVIGTQGLGGFRKWLLGSTTERLLRHVHIPVLAVPLAGEESAAAATADPASITQIVAATDFSEASAAAIQYAAELARQFSATLTVAHAVEPVTVLPQWRPLVDESDETRVAEARVRLNAWADQHCGSQARDIVVSIGRPAEAIASIAQERGARLIVMGLSGDKGRFAPVPGSIAYRVLSSTPVPVLVVPVGP